MSGWDVLERELDAWPQTGGTATFWWRDDDASRSCPALDRLFAAHGDLAVPLALAVIPAGADRSLCDRLADHHRRGTDIAVLQHGYAHRNYAPEDQKNTEFGADRSHEEVSADLVAGSRLLAPFPGFVPVLAPPWNRFADQWLGALPSLGFCGVSTFGPRTAPMPVAGLCQANAHIDIVNWRGDRKFIGEDAALAAAVAHLRQRRLGEVDADEPTGLLTHHKEHDDASWQFIAAFVRATGNNAATAWLNASEMFGYQPSATGDTG